MNALSTSRGARFMSRLLIATTAASAGAGVLAVHPASAATVGCGSTVTTNVTLQSDLICPNAGLLVGASGITIDLNGHSLNGSGNDRGIVVKGYNKITVTHGRIANFNTGMDIAASSGDYIHTVDLIRNLNGIDLRGVSYSSIVDAALYGKGGTPYDGTVGGNGIFVESGTGVYIGHNYLRDFYWNGINVGSYATDTSVLNNDEGTTVESTGIAVEGQNTTVNNNYVSHNHGLGIVFSGPYCYNSQCVPGATGQVTGNEVYFNTGNGIQVGGDGVSIGNNISADNNAYGIQAVSGDTDAGGNRAWGNDASPQCLNVTCTA